MCRSIPASFAELRNDVCNALGGRVVLQPRSGTRRGFSEMRREAQFHVLALNSNRLFIDDESQPIPAALGLTLRIQLRIISSKVRSYAEPCRGTRKMLRARAIKYFARKK